MTKTTITIKAVLLLSIMLFATMDSFGQHKKNINWYELDVNHGKLFQPNTIDPYSGTAHLKFGDGSKEKRIPIKDGKVHGKVEEWAMNGEKVAELEYVAGLPQGKEKQWYETGKPKLEAIYVDGKIDGIVTEWYESGKKKSEGFFTDNLEKGEHTWWFSNGVKEQVIVYENGKANGLVQHWHFNGQPRLKGIFKNGVENGDFEEWHPNGALLMKGSYANGIKNGIFKSYSKTELLLQEETFDNGTLIKDLNYRSGNINWPGGYTQVFNGKNSFYTVDLTGDNVYPRTSTSEIIYNVDFLYLQLLNSPVSLFQKTAPTDASKTLKNFVSYESDYITEKSGQQIEVSSEVGKTKNNIPYVYWHFKKTPKDTANITSRSVIEEHYVSLLCQEEVLSLYGLVTKVNDPADVKKMLLRIADGVKTSDERIELNALNKQLHRQK